MYSTPRFSGCYYPWTPKKFISSSKRWVKSCSLVHATRFSSFLFICHFPRAKNPHAKAESSLTNRNNSLLILANFMWAIINHSKSFMILFEQNSFILIHFLNHWQKIPPPPPHFCLYVILTIKRGPNMNIGHSTSTTEKPLELPDYNLLHKIRADHFKIFSLFTF